jgi:hypothetical protein
MHPAIHVEPVPGSSQDLMVDAIGAEMKSASRRSDHLVQSPAASLLRVPLQPMLK